jgi:hypothetical protein
MKFDANLAWQQASTAVSANRDVVLALAGVFYMLPSLGLALIYPPPQLADGASSEAVMNAMSSYYLDILPFVIPLLLFQAAGTLALLTLLTDRSRPTVAQAIGIGVRGIVPYVLAQVILALGIGVAGAVLIAITAAAGMAAAAALGIAAVVALAIYLGIRTSLAGPVIVVEGVRNPLTALQRSWRLTGGNTARIGLFYLLVIVAFLFVILVVTLVTGIVFSLLASVQLQTAAQAVISSLLEAVVALYFVAIIAAVHRQLAGRPAGTDSDTFA